MVNNAVVQLKNNFPGESIHVLRKPGEEVIDLDLMLTPQGTETIDLQSLDVLLEVHGPEGLDLKEYQFTIGSSVDLDISYSREHSRLTFKIAPNDVDPDIPTTVNISIGDARPA